MKTVCHVTVGVIVGCLCGRGVAMAAGSYEVIVNAKWSGSVGMTVLLVIL